MIFLLQVEDHDHARRRSTSLSEIVSRNQFRNKFENEKQKLFSEFVKKVFSLFQKWIQFTFWNFFSSLSKVSNLLVHKTMLNFIILCRDMFVITRGHPRPLFKQQHKFITNVKKIHLVCGARIRTCTLLIIGFLL